MLTTTTPSTNGDHHNNHNRSTPTQPVQSHPVRPAVVELFNLYLGRSGRNKSDDSIREPPSL
ncbi:Mediator complex, subunit Med23 [Artemisia annua]|uniref:Mediator complex, subunit Med23 n=1 Tax=Artemisia annua TaxID=35608 RepID=A0A2U1KC42_ARTAN|nr:Mediator complex, subunit Med23 [Artemisia annua]